MIHGGPESQARPGFFGRWNYFIDELGIALIEPNVRGSTGYGKTFVALDNGMKREDSVRDIGTLLDWIRTQPDLDADRVLVEGGSYGGYMALGVATTFRSASREQSTSWASRNSCRSWRARAYARSPPREYGTSATPQEECLHGYRRSTMRRRSGAAVVVAGRNALRPLPGEQIARCTQNGCRLVSVADNEGHGFARK